VHYLDEPTTGLDPRSRTDVWDMVRGLVADGVTVLLTTQDLDEADQLANDIVVIDHGKVVATGTPDELKAKTGGQVLQVSPADPGRIAEVTKLMAELRVRHLPSLIARIPAGTPPGPFNTSHHPTLPT
jgi:oleandomycin transport system ATP-binding protein